MSKVVKFRDPAEAYRPEPRGPKRWSVAISYRAEARLAPAVTTFEEFEDLGRVIEGGPDWNLIEAIVIRLDRRGEATE